MAIECNSYPIRARSAPPSVQKAPASAHLIVIYYRARYYDPKIGRFISEDPIHFDGGINFYTYVENNPVGKVDPFGLESGSEGYAQWTMAGGRETPATPGDRKVMDLVGKSFGCTLVCSIVGFADDVAVAGAGLAVKRIRDWATSAGGKAILTKVGVCGTAAAVVYCSFKCGP